MKQLTLALACFLISAAAFSYCLHREWLANHRPSQVDNWTASGATNQFISNPEVAPWRKHINEFVRLADRNGQIYFFRQHTIETMGPIFGETNGCRVEVRGLMPILLDCDCDEAERRISGRLTNTEAFEMTFTNK